MGCAQGRGFQLHCPELIDVSFVQEKVGPDF